MGDVCINTFSRTRACPESHRMFQAAQDRCIGCVRELIEPLSVSDATVLDVAEDATEKHD